MQVGVFVPINNNGWLISENSPQYMPSFDLNKEIALRAEKYGLDFLLSMIKLRGFGGKTEFWEYGMESFTLMAGQLDHRQQEIEAVPFRALGDLLVEIKAGQVLRRVFADQPAVVVDGHEDADLHASSPGRRWRRR